MPIDYPARYEFGLRLRGEAPPNALQMKLVDAGGTNVWWGRRNDYPFPAAWQTLRLRQREIEFAWGPTSDRALRRTERVGWDRLGSGGKAASLRSPDRASAGLAAARRPEGERGVVAAGHAAAHVRAATRAPTGSPPRRLVTAR